MKLAHNIKVSVFCKPEEDEKAILNKLFFLFPFNLEENKVKVKKTSAIGFNERKIKIYEIVIDKERHCKEFMDNLKENLNQTQKDLLLRQLDSRLDEELHFFIRLDKTKLIQDNEFFVTDSGNCYHMKIKIAAFPAKRGIAKKMVGEFLK